MRSRRSMWAIAAGSPPQAVRDRAAAVVEVSSSRAMRRRSRVSGGGRGSKQGVADGAVAGAGIPPRLDHDHGLVGHGALPGVEGDRAVAALGLGMGGSGTTSAPRVVESWRSWSTSGAGSRACAPIGAAAARSEPVRPRGSSRPGSAGRCGPAPAGSPGRARGGCAGPGRRRSSRWPWWRTWRRHTRTSLRLLPFQLHRRSPSVSASKKAKTSSCGGYGSWSMSYPCSLSASTTSRG